MKRILDCQGSDFMAMGRNDLLDAIAGSEGRTIACETIASILPMLGDITNAEFAAAMGADILLLNVFDVNNPVIRGLPKTEPENVIRKLKELTSTTIIVEVVLMTLSGGLLYLLAPDMVALFSDSQEVILLGAAVLRLVSLSEPVYGASVIIEGIMQGVGRTVAPFIFNIIGMWGIRIVGTFLCTRLLGYGLLSAWLCMVIHSLLLFVLLLTHYIRGGWNPMNKKETSSV